jgi:hypothetical protein
MCTNTSNLLLLLFERTQNNIECTIVKVSFPYFKFVTKGFMMCTNTSNLLLLLFERTKNNIECTIVNN